MNNPIRVVVAYGTRPERIKLGPVIAALRARGVEVEEWSSGQSKDLVTVEDNTEARIRANENWAEGLAQGVAYTMGEFADGLHARLEAGPPAAVVVQGDTATAFACALAAFLADIPVAHVEAGLRTYRREPWPEEAFRRMIAALATWHFCPDGHAAANASKELMEIHPSNRFPFRELAEGALTDLTLNMFEAVHHIYVTGNPVIDTLPKKPFRVLVTLHRRENWGQRITQALETLAEFSTRGRYPDTMIVRVVSHPNWRSWMSEDFRSRTLGQLCFVEPVGHDEMIEELRKAHCVVTDSGGLQEEAAHFGIPCIVLRTATERVALERVGAVVLVSPDSPRALVEALDRLYTRRHCYGDGDAGVRVAEILVRELTARCAA